jgi:hypothetical protein
MELTSGRTSSFEKTKQNREDIMYNRVKATEEQLVYAAVLERGMKIGLLAITITFLVYVTGALAPYLPVSDLPKYWIMPVKQYIKTAGVHTGWAWLSMLHKGDFLNFAGIAFLAGVTIICLFPVIPIFMRKKDRVYAMISVVEILILVLAASGILKAGGH